MARWLSLFAAFVVAGLSFLPHDGAASVPPVTVRVSPTVSFAPATVIVNVVVEPNADNRFLQIEADSEGMYRSSEVPLDGADAPHRLRFELRGLSRGTWSLAAIVKGTSERVLARILSQFEVA